jgi:hypothetical protein
MTKHEQVSVNLLSVQKHALKQLAEVEGETMSVIIRRLIREEAVAKGIWPENDANVGEPALDNDT